MTDISLGDDPTLPHDIGWFRDRFGRSVLVTQSREGLVLGFPATPGMVNEYLGMVPHAALRRIVKEIASWGERGAYEQLRHLVNHPPTHEEDWL